MQLTELSKSIEGVHYDDARGIARSSGYITMPCLGKETRTLGQALQEMEGE